jgi:hypothetical protein
MPSMKKVDNFPVAKCSQWKKLANPCGKMLSMGLETQKIQWQKALSRFGGGISIGKELSMGSEEEMSLTYSLYTNIVALHYIYSLGVAD